MVLHFTRDIDVDVAELQHGVRALALLQAAAPIVMTPPEAPVLRDDHVDAAAVRLYMTCAAAAYGSSALRWAIR